MPALVIEGGGSRAAYATGVLASLQSAGLVPDAIYGTSAGGALAAWYAAQQMDVACRTWDYVKDKRLLDPWRTFKRQPALQLGLLYRDYYPNLFGIDLATMRRAPYPVHATVTDLDSLETLYPDLRRVEDPLAWIHAGAAIPIIGDAPVELDGRRFVDGGTTDPIPIQRALEDGYRDVVVVLNRPPGPRKREPAWAVGLVARKFPTLREVARAHHEIHQGAVALAEHPPAGVRVRIVRPSADTGVKRTTRDVEAVRRAIEVGRRDGERAAREITGTP